MTTERISDLSDLATAHEEMFTRAAVSLRKPEGPPACGHCLNCEALLKPGLRWCDEDCLHDWEKYSSVERGK